MNIARLKQAVNANFPKPITSALKWWWQAGRRWINRAYFAVVEPGAVVLDIVKAESGQLNQPVVIDYLLGGEVGGFYLDIGANHPQFNSNTCFFERQRGFSGIALDPLEQYRSEWAQTRPNTLFKNVAAGAEPGTVTFFQQANVDGWADQLSFTSLSVDNAKGQSGGKQVQVVALADLQEVPADVSFASIDVEGAESQVLLGFRERLRPKVMVVENCFGPVGNRALRHQVKAMGYTLVGRISYIDDVFVRNDLAPTAPKLSDLRRNRRDLFC
jgi:FkbM family methyltransferase